MLELSRCRLSGQADPLMCPTESTNADFGPAMSASLALQCLQAWPFRGVQPMNGKLMARRRDVLTWAEYAGAAAGTHSRAAAGKWTSNGRNTLALEELTCDASLSALL